MVMAAATGEVVQELDYDARGRVTKDTRPGFQPFGFAGGLYDPESGLVRFGQREYDPSLGQWTSQDPLSIEGGDDDLYRYASGDPVNFTDPSGTTSLPEQQAAASTSAVLEGASAASGAVARSALTTVSRWAYVKSVEWGIAAMYVVMVANGVDEMGTAVSLKVARDATKIVWRTLFSTAEQVAIIEARCIKLYGNPLGPTVASLLAKGKSWQDIIKSAMQTGLDSI